MVYRLLILSIILALNGFFAAAEVSLLSVRRSRLRALADRGQLGAQAALNLLENPARLLSVTQVGVTLASLGLGWAGEDTIFTIIMSVVHPIVQPGTEAIIHFVGIAISFLVMSYGHVVLGEVVPKNLAIERADRLAVLVAPALLIFDRISSPFVYVAEHSAATVSRMIGLSGTNSSGSHSAEELKFIIASSARDGHLRKFEQEAIEALLDLNDYYVREIMVPRNSIVSMSADAGLDDVLRVMTEHQFSRLPVFKDTPEQIVGYVHFKDLMNIWEERRKAIANRKIARTFRMSHILRRLPIVPETKSLTDLMNEFRHTHRHMALVVDEFGTIAGLVTLEDILEQVFGEIGDEHDAKRPKPEMAAAVLEIEGSTSIRDLDSQYGIELPGDAGFETLAGFLLYQLRSIPRQGEYVEYGGRRYTVTAMDRNRIAQVRINRVAQPLEANAT